VVFGDEWKDMSHPENYVLYSTKAVGEARQPTTERRSRSNRKEHCRNCTSRSICSDFLLRVFLGLESSNRVRRRPPHTDQLGAGTVFSSLPALNPVVNGKALKSNSRAE
jgi:hypothetical protein